MDEHPISQPLPISTGIGVDVWHDIALPPQSGRYDAWIETATVMQWVGDLRYEIGKGWAVTDDLVSQKTLVQAWQHVTAMRRAVTLPAKHKGHAYAPDDDGWYLPVALPYRDGYFDVWLGSPRGVQHAPGVGYSLSAKWDLLTATRKLKLKMTGLVVLAWRFSVDVQQVTKPLCVLDYGKYPDADGWYRGFVTPPKSGRYDIYVTNPGCKSEFVPNSSYSASYGWAEPTNTDGVVDAWRDVTTHTKPAWID